MNTSAVFFLVLVSFASARVFHPKPRDNCKGISPEVYCHSPDPIGECLRHAGTPFCKYYMSTSICDRGPKAYCTIDGADVMCDKVEQCKTWPDDHVVAVNIMKKMIDRKELQREWLASGPAGLRVERLP